MTELLVPELYEIHDDRFAKLIHRNARMETLHTGMRWAEGPAWMAAGRYLVWSDIPNDRLMRWDETDGSVSVFREPCLNHNGHTVDAEGRLVACEHRGRAVSRVGFDGRREVLADRFDGKRFNSPNDVVVKRDGSVWFTDPSYGIDSEYEGDQSPMEQDGRHVYRIDPSGEVTRVVSDMKQPNGLAFSPDESLLYVADTGQTHFPGTSPDIRAYPVNPDGRTLGAGRVVCTCDVGLYDGFRVDRAGNIWSSAGDGVHCYAPDGTLLGKIRVDEVVANVAFGGAKLNRLFICATTSLRSIYINAHGISPFG